MDEEREIRFLGDVQRLRLEPGDIIVITSPSDLSAFEVQRIAEKVGKALPGHQVIVMGGGAKIAALMRGDGDE